MIDLSTWNLSIPVGVPATTISTPMLVGGFQDYYFRANTSTGTVVFWAPVTGSTTQSAVYPRAELRETFANGGLKNWTYPSADNYLSADLMVNQVPSSGKVVVGQIHAYNSDKPMLKLEFQYKPKTQTANLVAKIRFTPYDAEGQVYTLLSGIRLDQRFSYTLNLTPTGKLNIVLNDKAWSTQLSTLWAPKPLYFKAGVYIQDNTGYASEAGAATFDRLSIEHRAL
ncbi:polysaccharide lyase family 7 protein [Pseudomonas mangiferae]|uniref:Polysaccharide lyase family 7 protein n=1 Tax=Pseudomonas mangiferae TaxID=2593654 RepID=A0A553GTZ4_9PSED|nr:polysaccharide lyase family 7 protein [Pseudomonas mangiferae]TRX72960.1 polysaccharide lyase family 7 protein [Pseudomonas mangiferae]